MEIDLAPATLAKDPQLVEEVTDLVNQVYVEAEAGLWVDGASRTSTTEMEEMIAAGEVALARLGGRIVGCIRIQQLDGTAGELGMLAALPEHRGEGIGRELVRFAEDLSSRRGLAVMQLELLVPRTWSHPTKVFLHEWYTRIGYRTVRTGNIEESYPHLAPLLATPCDFVIYHKLLAAGFG